MAYAIVADSNSQLGDGLVKKEGIEMMPFPCGLGDKTYYDGVDTDAGKFLAEMKADTKVPVRTAAIEPGTLEQAYRKLAKAKKTIISMHMASGLSQATHEVVEQVRKKVPAAKVYLHDCMSLGAGDGLQVYLTAVKARTEKGIKPEELLDYAVGIRKRTVVLGGLPDLGYLHRGGRIGRARSLLGMLMGIIPIIQCRGEDNIISAYGKGRNLKQVNRLMVESMKRDLDKLKGEKAMVLYSAMPDNEAAGQDLAEQLAASGVPMEQLESKMNTCLCVHGGPGSWFFGYTVL